MSLFHPLSHPDYDPYFGFKTLTLDSSSKSLLCPVSNTGWNQGHSHSTQLSQPARNLPIMCKGELVTGFILESRNHLKDYHKQYFSTERSVTENWLFLNNISLKTFAKNSNSGAGKKKKILIILQ